MLLAILGVVAMFASNLPVGSAPAPVPLSHFPDRLHAYVWRNWSLVPTARLAQVVGAKPAEIVRMGKAMGLPAPPAIPISQQRRSTLTIIRRNWHLLPYDQLLQLLNWTPEQMAYSLQEDDFLYIKLGSLKPRCEPIRYTPPTPETLQREQEIAQILHQEFPQGLPKTTDPLFRFVTRLSQSEEVRSQKGGATSTPDTLHPKYCYSYFALYGDPLLEKGADPYPQGYLEKMAAVGVDGVWLQGVLYKLAPFPWDKHLSEHYEERLKNLRALVARAKRQGIGIYLYLNEPRAMPLAFFEAHPELKGVTEGDQAALCTGNPEVRKYLTDSIASICRAVPDLAGFFTITASENFTNCWSHGKGADCPRCRQMGVAVTLAGVNRAIQEGIQQANSKAQLIAWDWGWPDAEAEAIINLLPKEVAFMSVSEWNLPIKRGGVESIVGEYSISSVGPGPRATRHWAFARQHGLKTLAKIQAANTWELSAVPYIPALENVAQHALNLRSAQVDGLMLGWTLGGYPSPNLEVVAEVGKGEKGITTDEVLRRVATKRFGADLAPAVVAAWKQCSAAFREFPYHIGMVYTAPMQFGPSNLLWAEPTGYHATMIGFPYDDLDTWRAVYPPEVFISQFTKMAEGFDQAVTALKSAFAHHANSSALQEEISIMEAASLHFRSTANQARFVVARRALTTAKTPEEAKSWRVEREQVLREEITLARRLCALQVADSRLGFEASNQYYYVPIDLLEKIVNCHDLLRRSQ